jgi:hypothetical protein
MMKSEKCHQSARRRLGTKVGIYTELSAVARPKEHVAFDILGRLRSLHQAAAFLEEDGSAKVSQAVIWEVRCCRLSGVRARLILSQIFKILAARVSQWSPR